MKKIIKNKKAGIEDYISQIVIVVVVVCIVLAAVFFRADIISLLGNAFPTLGGGDNSMGEGIGGLNDQPVELRGPDSCIDADFFWSDLTGKILNGQTVKPQVVYVAIRFKDDVGNLIDKSNPKISCGEYSLVIRDEYEQIDNKQTFSQIQQYSETKIINGEVYYMVKQQVSDPGFGKIGQYFFNIKKGDVLKRAGYLLSVNA